MSHNKILDKALVERVDLKLRLSNETDLKSSLEYKVMLLKKAILEFRSRKKYFYYTYEPSCFKSWYAHLCGKKIKIAKGSPRSSKTTTLHQDLWWHILGEHPFDDRLKNVEDKKRCWVVATSFAKVKNTLLPFFKEHAPLNRIVQIIENDKERDYRIIVDNGWIIRFMSQEQQDKEFTSDDVRIIFLDERPERESLWWHLRSRVISTDGIMYCTMDTFSNDDWLDSLKGKDYVEILHYQYEDNEKNLPKAEGDRLREETDDVYKAIMFDGQSKERGIDFIFDDDSIWNNENYLPVVPESYSFVRLNNKWELVPEENGVFKMFIPKQTGLRYLVGLDMAGGKGHKHDCHGLQVVDEYGEQVARCLNNTIHYTVFVEKFILPILEYYNNALFVAENKSYGEWTINTIKEVYHNIYCDYFLAGKFNKNVPMEYGIKTSDGNKEQMVLETLADIKSKRFIFHDEKTYKQFKTVVKDSRDRGTQKKVALYYGKKIRDDDELMYSDDDLVMAMLFIDRAMNRLRYFNRPRRGVVPRIIDDRINKNKTIRFINGVNAVNGYDNYYSNSGGIY